MSTYEEDVVDIYFNLNGYFTVKNIPFSAVEKRPGGKGRGEIDVLAVKVKDGKLFDVVWAEVSFSTTAKTPWKDSESNTEAGKILKKFFETDAIHEINHLIGNIEPKSLRMQYVSSELYSDAVEKLKKMFHDLGAEVEIREDKRDCVEPTDLVLELWIKYKGETKRIEVIPFSVFLHRLFRLFKNTKFTTANFQDPRMRGIQHFVREMKKK